jgi:homoserine dehydrogenase
MILSGFVFGRQLRREDVACSGIVDIDRAEFERGGHVKHVATLDVTRAGTVSARVTPELVGPRIRWRT